MPKIVAKSQSPLRMVWGAGPIGEVLGISQRQAFHRLENDQLPGAKKVGATWTLNLDVFEKSFTPGAE